MSEKLKPCPFCGEDDFDLIGLKHHFEQGYCPVYETTSRIAWPYLSESETESKPSAALDNKPPEE